MCLIDTYSHVRGKVPYKSTYTSKKSILKMCNGRQLARVSFRNKLELASQSFSSVGIFCQCIMVTPHHGARNLWWIDVYLCYFWLWSSLGIGQVVYSLAAKPRAAPAYSSAL